MAVKWYKIYDFDEDGEDPQPLFSVRTIDVKGKLVCLGRLPDGYFAVDDRCPHSAGGRLGMGKCDEHGIVTCPIHRFRYDLKTGKGLQSDFVNNYEVETRTNGVYIGIKQKSWWPF